MSKVSPCLWFGGEAEEATKFYVSLLPDSRNEKVQKNTVDSPAGKAGSVLVVDFTLAGQRFMALNGGPMFKLTPATSLFVSCKDQDEIDRYWDALLRDGGEPSRCGWLTDRFGLTWQIIPEELPRLIRDPRGRDAMMAMVKIDLAALRAAVAS